ncbi:4226_t:CDS:1, partial [Paraglomus occultum]
DCSNLVSRRIRRRRLVRVATLRSMIVFADDFFYTKDGSRMNMEEVETQKKGVMTG